LKIFEVEYSGASNLIVMQTDISWVKLSEEKKTAYCGINCSECEAHLATRAEDHEGLAELAKRWGGQRGRTFTAEDLACDGCHSGRINIYCRECSVRACGTGKGHSTCADCGEYICEKLETEWESWYDASWEQAKSNLDGLR
jgi:hypothetical protein